MEGSRPRTRITDVAESRCGKHTDGVHVTQLEFALLVPWLALGALTVAGARRRGDGWLPALLTGLLFWPVAWVAWYLVDKPHGRRRWDIR